MKAVPSRLRIAVEGIVQGVGFRPFVAALADRLDLCGFVGNDTSGVFIEVEGPDAAITTFLTALCNEPPALARVERVSTTRLDAIGGDGFTIVASTPRLDSGDTRDALVTADAATCIDCLHEIRNPNDRRFGYPFTNCTNCGPRYTIVRDVPYDRERTTMAAFTMCALCQAEYDDPLDRRFHAQPVCCADCGPALRLEAGGETVDADPIESASARLLAGDVVAVKGLGGYHLAADASNEAAVNRLRARKHREDRPFALMVSDVAAARALCVVDDHEARLLSGTERPIVLLRRRPKAAVAAGVAPRTHELGIMLAYTPLHHLLLDRLRRPLVLTSGNISDEPIAFDDEDAFRRLGSIADAFLTHDRPIQTRVDDSVARCIDGAPMVLRRSRGYAPSPVWLPWEFTRPVLACGPELKNTFCVGRGHHAFLSPHIGDLENFETLEAFIAGIEHLQRLFGVTPEVVAYDLHPDYLSTKYAMELAGVDLVGVQHHHAHIASCLADNRVAGPVIGVAFDGTGYGPDATVWGGEFLIADLHDATRAAHIAAVRLPGGAAAIREPWRMAASYLDAAYGGEPPADLDISTRQGARWDSVRTMAAAGLNSPLTSSAGRLFDAVAALLDVRDEVTYEGQAAVELEQLADQLETGHYSASISDEPIPVVNAVDLIRAVVADRRAHVSPAIISARFHHGVTKLIVDVATKLRDRHGLNTVALSGGVFQNVLLVRRSVEALNAAGFEVLTHHQVPPNDGGISLGQAVVATARGRTGRSSSQATSAS